MIATWTEGEEDATHDELGERLATVAMVAGAKGGGGTRTSPMTWDQWLGHPSSKTVVALAESGTDGMVIMDLLRKQLVLVDVLHALQRNQYTCRTGKGEIVRKLTWFVFTSIGDHTRAVHMRPLQHKSDVLEVFRIFKAAAENESQRKMCEVGALVK